MTGSLIIKIENILNEINMHGSQLTGIYDYFEGEIDEQFLIGLPEINLYSIEDKYLKKLAELYGNVKQSGNELDLTKYIKMMFKIFADTMSIIIRKYDSYGFKYEMEKLKIASVDTEIIIRVYADYLATRDYICRYGFGWFAFEFKSLDCETQKNIIRNLEDSVNRGIGNEKALLLLYSLFCSYNNETKMAEDYIKNADKMIINFINNNILNHMDLYIKDSIFNLISNSSSYNEDDVRKLLSELKGHQYFNDRYYILFNVCILLNSEKSILCRNYIKLIIQYSFKELLDNLNEVLSEEEIIKCLKVIKAPVKYIVAWKSEKRYDDDFFKEEYIDDPEEFRKGVDLSSLINQNYLIRFLLDDSDKDKYIKILNESCISEVMNILKLKNTEDVLLKNCEKFLRGDVDFCEIKDSLNLIENKADIYSSNNKILKNTLNTFTRIKGCKLFKRTILILTCVKENAYINSIYPFVIENFEKFIELFEKYKIDITFIMSFMGFFKIYKNNDVYMEYIVKQKRQDNENDKFKYLPQKRREDIIKNMERKKRERIRISLYIFEYVKKICHKYRENIIKNIKNVDPETRMTFLYSFSKENTEDGVKILLDNFDDKSKDVKDYLIALFSDFKNMRQYLDKIIIKASSKKKDERELAVKILLKYLDSNEINEEEDKKITLSLNKVLSREKTKSIKALFKDNVKFENIKEDIIEKEDIDNNEIIKHYLKFKNMNSLSWLEFEQLSKVKLKNEKEFASDDILKAMIFIYRGQKELIRIKDGDTLSKLLDTNDLNNFAVAIFNKWLQCGSNVKEKWVLPFTSAYGGNMGIESIKNQIKNWYKVNKIIIAQYALCSLNIIKTKQMFLYFYNYKADCCSPALKSQNNTILASIADEMKINYGELFTKLLLDKNDELHLDYGNRKFKVWLNDKAALDVFNEEGRKIRGIPKPEGGNQLQIREHEKYNTLRSKVKLQVKRYLQSLNHERGMLRHNYSKEEWVKAFINSPILRRLSYGIIWGVYNEDKLIDTFMYMKDSTFNSINDDVFDFENVVNGSRSIKAVNKSELSKTDIDLWQKQLEDYEIFKYVKQFE